MGEFWLDAALILILILANGFFAGAELGIVSARRSRIDHLAAEGSKRARAVQKLLGDPHRFLATVQIGVTLVGTMASAVGGAAAIEVIKPFLQQLPFPVISNAAEPLALFLVVGSIAYLSLVLGELVPKALALENPVRTALWVARPIGFFSRIGGAAIFILSLSSRSVLALLGVHGKKPKAMITKDEIQHLISEGQQTGAVSTGEQEFIRNVFEFSRTQVRQVMVPRPRIAWLNLAMEREEVFQVVLDGRFSRYPVYEGEPENVLGFIHAKDLLGQTVKAEEFDLAGLLHPALFVPEAKKVNDLLREMQHRHIHMAMVVDEYGSLTGVVTTEDLLEELVGEIEDEHDREEPQRILPLKNGGFLVDALLPLNDLEDLLGVRFPDNPPYETLAGFILFELGHLPVEGERVTLENYLLTCVKVSGTAIRRVKIEPVGRSETQGT